MPKSAHNPMMGKTMGDGKPLCKMIAGKGAQKKMGTMMGEKKKSSKNKQRGYFRYYQEGRKNAQ